MIQTVSFKLIKKFFTEGHERTLRAKKNVGISFLCKVSSIIISFLIVPLTLGYVGKVEYGIWMTISAIIQWFVFFDIGLGNGLRNKLAEALALNDEQTIRTYISSSFAIITGIAGIMFIGFFIAANFISWNAVLNTDIVSNNELQTIVLMVFFFFCTSFIMGLTSSILQAMQRYAINDILGLAAQLLGLVALYVLVHTTEGSLFYLCLVYGSKTAIVMTVATLVLFHGLLKKYRPAIRYINIKKAFPLLNLGLKFFLGQILYLIVNQTSLILVVQFFGPEDVTVFNLALRYISITSMGYMMILTPFLSAFTEAYTKHEYNWIKSIINKINLIWLFTSIVTLFMILGYKPFFHFWIGDKIVIPLSLIIALAISTIINNWGATFSLFLNGIGKINLQLYLISIYAVLFFPLSYLFYKLEFGLVSIVAAQIILFITSAFFMTIQYKKIINQTAVGIWAK